MPVRSRGPLLAGKAILAGVLLAGSGCQSSLSDHDAFAIPNSPSTTPGSLFARHAPAMTPMVNSGPMPVAAPTPMVSYGQMPAAAPTPAALVLQSVPVAQSPAEEREVIASTWSPVQRVNAKPPVLVRKEQGTMPVAVPANSP